MASSQAQSEQHTSDVADSQDIATLFRLANGLIGRFSQLMNIDDLNNAIILWRRLFLLTPPGNPNQLPVLGNLANAFRTRFDVLGRREDLDAAISLQKSIIDSLPSTHRLRPSALFNLANALQAKFQRTKDQKELEEAINLHREALELNPAFHPDRSASFSSLAAALISKFNESGASDDLIEAIEFQRAAVHLRSATHPDLPNALNNLASMLTKSHLPEDLDESIELHRQALRLFSTNHGDRLTVLKNLRNSLNKRYEVRGEVTDLDEIIELQREAVEMIINSPNRFEYLDYLADKMKKRFEISSDRKDLNDALDLQREAIELSHAGPHPDRPVFMHNFALDLRTSFDAFGDTEHLEEAISICRKALLLPLPPALEKSALLRSLGNSLSSRYSYCGELNDLQDAILHLREALSLNFLESSTCLPFLVDLANVLTWMFDRKRQRRDLDEAISLYREALELPSMSPDSKSTCLSNISVALHMRYEHSNNDADLEEAVLLYREAFKTISPSSSGWSTLLNGLACALKHRFDKKGDRKDLEEAIILHREAIQLRPDAHPLRSSSLNNLANAVKKRFDEFGHVEDLEECIELHRQAHTLRALPHPDHAATLHNLALALKTRSEKLDEIADLNESIDMLRQCLIVLTPDHHMVCGVSWNLGIALINSYTRANKKEDLEDAVIAFRRASKSSSAPISERFLASWSWAHYVDQVDHESALEAYQVAIELLPRLATLGIDVKLRQEILKTKSNGLARSAATCAIRRGQLEKAVELLEEGRGIFWSQALQLRTPMDDLKTVSPLLEAKLREISKSLEQRSFRTTDLSSDISHKERSILELKATKFQLLNSTWMTAVEDVRKLPGFEHFMLPRRFSELKQAAFHGPLIILNSSASASDILIITSNVQHIPIPNLDLKKLNSLVQLLRMANTSGGKPVSAAESSKLKNIINCLNTPTTSLRAGVVSNSVKMNSDSIFLVVLAELWDNVVEPVVRALQLEKRDQLPTITWCPTGSFIFLPIHAAGRYDTNPPICASDFFISSYAPTISALLRKNTPRPTDPSTSKMMVVVQPETLPSTQVELKNIEARLPSKYLVKMGISDSPATVEKVLSNLPATCIAHFACHGYQDLNNPLESGLILDDGHLKISQMMRCSLPNASIAFLCACETAMGTEEIPDEVIHLAASLIFTGFKGVIATMWSISDDDGPAISDAFYENLFHGISTNFELKNTNSPQALHHAVARLRAEKISFSRWVPFIHIGS
ncbi:CHAT domain-containing protein [Crucibulum laeve]|uniref:CHAT domain-containing protein n=1 Tax=Crucibulum laeve TaxID=68775 RepID=A0A5C3LT71_9AGAR|nr:CHAT domain-containing protein [Crucibulum laeve]